MSNRTVLVISILCAVLAGYIFLVERQSPSTRERQARRNHVFAELRLDVIRRLEIEGPHGLVILEKPEVPGTPGMAPEDGWRLLPGDVPADALEMRALLSALDYLLIRRTVADEGDAVDRGLDPPMLRATITAGRQQIAFRVGNVTADGETRYLQRDEPGSPVLVVNGEFLEALDRDANDLRRRRLLGISAGEIKAVTLFRGDRRLSLSSVSDGYRLTIDEASARRVVADPNEVKRLLSALEEMTVVTFVSDSEEEEDLATRGINAAGDRIEIVLETGASMTLLFGAACDDDTVHVSVAGSRSVQCVSSRILERLDTPVPSYVERRVFRFAQRNVRGITIEEGSSSLALTMDDNGLWQAGALSAADTQQADLSTLLDELSRVTGDPVVYGPEADAACGRIVRRWTVSLTDQTDHSISIHEAPEVPTDWCVRPEGEARALWVRREVLPDISADEGLYRSRTLHRGDVHDVEALEIRGPLSQTLTPRDGAWIITAPVTAMAATREVETILGMVLQTRVERWVGAAEAKRFGEVFATLMVTLPLNESRDAGQTDRTGTRTVVLEIGDPAEDDTRYARMPDEGRVFTLGQREWSLMERPLADPGALRIVTEGLNRMVLHRDQETLEWTRQGDEWRGPCEMDGAIVMRILLDLGAARALTAVAFGDRLGRQRLQVDFHSDRSDQPATLHFGDPAADVPGYHARRADLDVTYIFPARLVDELLGLCPASGTATGTDKRR